MGIPEGFAAVVADQGSPVRQVEWLKTKQVRCWITFNLHHNKCLHTLPRCTKVTLCCWWDGLVLRQGGPLGIQEEVVEEINFLFDGGHLVSMFVEDVLSHKLRSLCEKDDIVDLVRADTHVCTQSEREQARKKWCLTLNFLPLRGQSHLSLLSSWVLVDRNFSTYRRARCEHAGDSFSQSQP